MKLAFNISKPELLSINSRCKLLISLSFSSRTLLWSSTLCWSWSFKESTAVVFFSRSSCRFFTFCACFALSSWLNSSWLSRPEGNIPNWWVMAKAKLQSDMYISTENGKHGLRPARTDSGALSRYLPFVYDQRLKKIALVRWSRHILQTLRQNTQLRYCSVKAWKTSSTIIARLKINCSRSHFDNLRSLPTLLSLFFQPLFSPQTRSREQPQINRYTNLQSFLSLLQWLVSRSQFPTATLSANEIEYLLQTLTINKRKIIKERNIWANNLYNGFYVTAT